jgi:hypothetical protein
MTPKVSISMNGFSLDSKKPLKFAVKGRDPAPSPSYSRETDSSERSPRPGQAPSSKLGKRPRAQFHDGSDDEGERVQHEEVTGFDLQEGGALRKAEQRPSGPLVIPRLKTRDWREEIRRARGSRNLLPPEIQAQRRAAAEGNGAVETSVEGEGVAQWGLTITKTSTSTLEVSDTSGTIEQSKEEITTDVARIAIEESSRDQPRAKTDDELALEALLGKQTEKKGPDLVISTQGNGAGLTRNEEDAYKRAIMNAPDVSTLEDYERVPVEEFGAALLRGMGWKEGDSKNGRIPRPKEVKRRQNQLGLGATKLDGAEELGAWVQTLDPKRVGSGGSRPERRPRANEYREREERRREDRDDRYGSHRRDRDSYRDGHRDGQRDRYRDR